MSKQWQVVTYSKQSLISLHYAPVNFINSSNNVPGSSDHHPDGEDESKDDDEEPLMKRSKFPTQFTAIADKDNNMSAGLKPSSG